MAFAVTTLYLFAFNFIFLRFKKLQFNAFKPWVTVAMFNLKFVAGLLIWAVYTLYYKDLQNNDVHKFYNDAVVLYEIREADADLFWMVMLFGDSYCDKGNLTGSLKNWERNFDEAPINENRTVIRLNALLMFLSFKTYFVHILFMCFLSLAGWVLLYNSVFTNSSASILGLVVLLLPSVLFWSSGVMKEPILVFGLGVFVAGLVNKNTTKHILLLLLGSLLIVSVKFYVMACLLPSAIAFLVLKNSNYLSAVVIKYVATLAIVALLAFNIQRIVPNVNPVQILVNKHTHSVKEAAYFNAGSRIEISELTDATSILKAVPVGIWNVVFRPYLWEGKNMMVLASALEIVLVLAILLLCFLGFQKANFTQINLALFLLVSSVTYFALIGISTPVLGNIVRYKAPLLPFFLFAFLLVADLKQMPGLNWLQREGA